MIRINEHYLKLQASYLFSDIAKRVAAFQKAHPDAEVIKLGIGDVTRPLPPACIAGVPPGGGRDGPTAPPSAATVRSRATTSCARRSREDDFQARGADIAADEIFVSDGSKCDTGNIQEIFATDIAVAIPDPVYPVYVDTNVMAGRTGAFTERPLRAAGLPRLHGGERLHPGAARGQGRSDLPLLPQQPDRRRPSPGPSSSGGSTTRAPHQALILFDAAYEAFIRDDALPHSIFEIEGAREVAIEFRSFSKTGGFTGTRCAYTVVPKACTAYTAAGEPKSRARPLEPPPHHQVQRRLLPGAARGRGGVQPRRARASAGS